MERNKNHCEDVGLEFMSSPFSVEAVNLLEDLNVKSYKIGSGEVTKPSDVGKNSFYK